ncbi:ribonuclease HII [Lyngbya confervoides]|uniref:Ribonuclease HII n=1 Tax=Lyngbya confervoides BDU141951 TaxID=1574623 RepID=A0ABD4T6J4_9CYAN|nr:ribonuclease HII [Lyngbya confervoides]MCM1984333.1 ribonuclease HII [Lyngbya confervoides BDU141951]
MVRSIPSHRIAGVDEVGRGCLFGPVVAAAVIIPAGGENQLAEIGVTDSKRLTPGQRSRLYAHIVSQTEARIGLSSVREIDRLNILQASLLAMKRALDRLQTPPLLCLVDGNRPIPNLQIPQKTVVKGDQTEIAIAAASIVAKVWRDRLLERLDRRYPGYCLASNKGYGSVQHRDALRSLGLTPQHRLSFSPCQRSLDL